MTDSLERRVYEESRQQGFSHREANAVAILATQNRELPREPRFESIQRRCKAILDTRPTQ